MLAIALGLVLATAVGLLGWRFVGKRPALDLEADRANAELVAAITTRQLAPRGLELDPAARGGAARLVRERLSEADMRSVFSPAPNMVFDPVCYYRFRGGLAERNELADVPGGFWTRRTNGDGAREDHELVRENIDTFVLAIGDSHTEGICDNADSWPNQFERRLAAARPGERVEVYDTGTSSYSLFHYWGVLEKYLPLAPDAVIVCVYGGNDFVETLRPYAFQRGVPLPPRPEGYFEELVATADLGTGALLQGLNQALFFREHPEQRDLALTAAVGAVEGLRELCEARGIPWLVIYVPSVFDRPFVEFEPVRARARESLGLSDVELAAANALADALIARTRENGTPWLDLRERLELDGDWYWSEMHLSISANRRIAELLAESLAIRPRRGR